MGLLLLKSWRDLRTHWVAFLSCACMIGLGAALFVAFTSSVLDLKRSCDVTYERLNFLDFTLPVHSGSSAMVERLRRIPGVAGVTGRLSARVRIVLKPRPGDLSAAAVHVKGLALGTTPGSHPAVNDVYIEDGHYLQGARGEALLEKRFAQSYGYRLGDEIRLLYWGERVYRYTVVGFVTSPEFLWLADDRLDPRSAARNFGVVFLSPADLADMTRTASFNEIHVRVHDKSQRDSLMAEAQRQLGPAAPEPPIPSEEQASNSLLIRDRHAFSGMAVLFPLVFSGLSAIILMSTMWQLVTQQRRVIGVLMTQGVSAWQLVLHYLALSLMVGVSGAGLGALGGHLLGQQSTAFYARTLGLPFVATGFHGLVIAAMAGGVLLLSLAAGAVSVQRILSMNPVQALRSEFDSRVRESSPKGRWSLPLPSALHLPYRLRLPLRNLRRQPARSGATVLGIAFAVTQILIALALFDSQRATLDYYFRQVHTYNLQVGLTRIVSPASLPPIERWPGVLNVEGHLCVGARFRHHGTTIERAIWGLPSHGRLLRLYDAARQPIEVEPHGPLWLGPLPSRRLRTGPGETVTIQVGQPKAVYWDYQVGPQLYEPLANPPKLPLERLRKHVAAMYDAPRDGVNILLMSVSPPQLATVTRQLLEEKWVRNVMDMSQMQEDIHDQLRMFEAYCALILLFSGLLAFTLVLGTTTMNVMERSRELATMSALGVRDRDLALFLVVEAVGLWGLGLALGIPGGILLGNWVLGHYQSDLIQLSISLHPASVLKTAFFSLTITMLAILHGLRRVQRIPVRLVCNLE